MSLEFRATIHKSGKRFFVPKKIRASLNLSDGNEVEVEVRTEGGQVLFSGRKQLMSGSEIYGRDLPDSLAPGLKATVRISLAAIPQNPRSNSVRKRFWVVSPNVMNNVGTVGEWRNASIKFRAAFMGWGPDEEEHKAIGAKFAKTILPGDIILIARRFNHKVEVVGFGTVRGPFKKGLEGFVAPEKDRWRGSLRVLRPFKHRTELPRHLKAISALGHTTALRELVPARSESEQRLCEWLERELSQQNNEARSNRQLENLPKTELIGLPNDEGLDYKVTTRAQARRAEKKEAELVQQYDKWLRDQGRTLHVAKYGQLRCDAFEADRCNLIEAKCSSNREYVRMAVGQLLDYSNLIGKDVGVTALAVLLPGRPAPDIENWLKEKLSIHVIWRDGNVFLDNANGRFI